MGASKKEVRRKFRLEVFKRDKNKCRVCDTPASVETTLDAHHITDRNEMPYGGYVKENGIALCPKCHRKAELFHETGGKQHEAGFHPNDLYKKIGSSIEQADAASMKLR